MTTLLELKEKLVRFYGKYEVYITPIVKFIVAFAALMTIDRNIGYMELVSSTPVSYTHLDVYKRQEEFDQ